MYCSKMAFCIEKFSSSLCLGFASGMSPSNTKLASFGKIENPLDVCNVILKLYEKYVNALNLVIDEISDADRYNSFELFMKATISRCLKLSTNPTPFHFMLVCTFINATIARKFADVKCFTFAKVASQSLIAVYERRYNDLFQTDEETLSSVCKRLRELLTSSEEENKCKLPSEKEINHQLLSLVHIDDRNFVLERSERDMLMNAQICIPSESSCETGSQTTSIDGGMCLKEEDLSRANQDCDFCGAECYNIYLAYLREVNQK